MERLRVQIVLDIIYRLRAGQSQRSIVRDLGYARDTVRRYAEWAMQMGYLEPASTLPTLENLQVELPLPTRKSNISGVEPYREVVKSFLDQGVEMVTIHRRLVRNHGYTGSLWLVFCRKRSSLLCGSRRRRVRRCRWISAPPARCETVEAGSSARATAS